jgi:ABC-2 type transport system ATP-binding protein
MSANEPAVTARDVMFSYGTHPALVGVRWEVPAGRTAAVFGLSGAGKSTLLQVLAGVLKPQSGEVALLGQDPQQAATRKLLGYMPQTGGLYNELSVEENLQVFARASGARVAGAELIEKTLEVVGLRQRRKDPVNRLPAGMAARASLAAALVAQPSVLLLDEPLAHADPEFIARFWAHMAELNGKGRTVVIATSQPAVASRVHQLGLLRGGRLVAQGELASLTPRGRAKVRLSFREKTGPLPKESVLQDYAKELPALLFANPARPFLIEVEPERAEDQLSQLLSAELADGTR